MLAFAVVFLLLTGCGTPRYRIPGRITQGGQPFQHDDDDAVAVTFVPIPPEGEIARDYFYAEVDQKTGTFWAAGGTKKGIPLGKYRVAIELKRNRKDLFKGKYGTENSPFVFDIVSGTQEIVIDLDKQPGA
jgi:hypothetical protein